MLVEVTTYFDKKGILNMLSYLQALVILEVWRKSKRRIRNILVELRAYSHKQGILNMLNYLQASVILEVKSMKSSTVYTNIVTFIGCIGCFGFI